MKVKEVMITSGKPSTSVAVSFSLLVILCLTFICFHSSPTFSSTVIFVSSDVTGDVYEILFEKLLYCFFCVFLEWIFFPLLHFF